MNIEIHNTALGLTQPLTEISTRNISWGVNAAGAYGWQPYHLHVPIVLKSGTLNLLEPSGSVQACNGIALPLYVCIQKCTSLPSAAGKYEPISKGTEKVTKAPQNQVYWVEFHVNICGTNF